MLTYILMCEHDSSAAGMAYLFESTAGDFFSGVIDSDKNPSCPSRLRGSNVQRSFL